MDNKKYKTAYIIAVLLLLIISLYTLSRSQQNAEYQQDINKYIADRWDMLYSSGYPTEQLIVDTKLSDKEPLRVFITRNEVMERVKKNIFTRMKNPAIINITVFPMDPLSYSFENHENGMVYLPYPYVVSGGRFNELHGWDSYFIVLGLIRHNRYIMAENIANNLVYEINNYGKVLSSNRSYNLQCSNQPFFSRMSLEIYYRTENKKWLEAVLEATEKYYKYWTQPPHLTPQTGLSRYYGMTDTPCQEALYCPLYDKGRNYYDMIIEAYYNLKKSKTETNLPYNINDYYIHNKNIKKAQLKKEFFIADRAVRESGFYSTGRFGLFGAGITDYNPVCLNSLLYVMEKDLAEMNLILGNDSESRQWINAYLKRKELINRYMWDNDTGLYYDYNFTQKQRSNYRFVTSFYPRWAGIPDKTQAKRLVDNLAVFERAGGVSCSDKSSTQNQWDDPAGWAPMQVITAQALEEYGFKKDAERIALKWCSTILGEYKKYNNIYEKYDINKCSREMELNPIYRYTEYGPAWTGASFVVLLDIISDQNKTANLK